MYESYAKLYLRLSLSALSLYSARTRTIGPSGNANFLCAMIIDALSILESLRSFKVLRRTSITLRPLQCFTGYTSDWVRMREASLRLRSSSIIDVMNVSGHYTQTLARAHIHLHTYMHVCLHIHTHAHTATGRCLLPK